MASDKQNFTNLKYSAGVPLIAGDRRYSQDYVRDMRFMQYQIARLYENAFGDNNAICNGLVVTQGAGDTINVTVGSAYVLATVSIPDQAAAWNQPMTEEEVDIRMLCEVPALTNSAVTVTVGPTYYVKLAYAEDNGTTRTRAKKAGAYSYEVEPSYTITTTTVVPTAYEIELTRFTKAGGGVFSFTNTNRIVMFNRQIVGTNSTQSTTKNTGAIVTEGGIGAEKNIHAGGTIKNNDTTQSVSKDTGSIITEGGIGVEKNIHAGGTIKNDDTTQSTSKDTGSIVTEGGIGVEKNIWVGSTVQSVSKDTGSIITEGGIGAEKNIHAGGTITADGGTKRGSAGTVLLEKIVDIGDWNMDSVGGVSVNHTMGASYLNIRNISVIIRDDSNTTLRSLTSFGNAADPALLAGGVSSITSTQVILNRRTLGFFDTASHDSTSYNRGWIYILYTA